MIELTAKQQLVLDCIVTSRVNKGYSPTYQEMAEELDCSANAIVGHVKALERKGAVSGGRGRARMIMPV